MTLAAPVVVPPIVLDEAPGTQLDAVAVGQRQRL